jgi:hypothetical protein
MLLEPQPVEKIAVATTTIRRMENAWRRDEAAKLINPPDWQPEDGALYSWPTLPRGQIHGARSTHDV